MRTCPTCFVSFLSLLILVSALAAPASAQCDSPKTDAQRIACLGQELRQTDQKINDVYKELMGKLSEAGKKQLRSEQRAWLKARTATCKLNDKEFNREKWFQQILASPATTVCVVRFTGQRVNQLEAYRSAAADQQQALPKEETYEADDSDDYQYFSGVERSKGKWYFEVWLDVGKIASKVEAAMWIEISGDEGVGSFVTIRKRDRGEGSRVIGIAADLDNGKLYVRENGEWNDAPGSNTGTDVKLNRSYKAGIDSSVSLGDLIKSGLIRPNFGKQRFVYALPDGYRPFEE